MLFDSIVAPQTPPVLPYNEEALQARRDVLRLAALLHDVGHCAFSHVSEKFYAQDRSLEQARKALSDHYGVKISHSEALSILILRSSAFKQLLISAAMRRSEFDEERVIEMICACVAGSKGRTKPDSFLAEIINGPVDCDKLDYLARDGHMAGVPISLDIDRLFSKLRVVRVQPGDVTLYTLAIVPSAARALEELLVSRIFLYDKFYYHPKVMAAEELVRRALQYLSRAVPAVSSPATLLEFGDDELLFLTPESVSLRFQVEAANAHVAKACALFARARNRDLPRRAFAFARRFLPEAPDVYARFESHGKADPVYRGVDEYKTLSGLLDTPNGRELEAEKIACHVAELGVHTDVFVGFQAPERATGSSISLPVLLPNDKIVEKPNFLFEANTWSEAYALNKATSYVFAYDDLPKVHLAAERMFADRGLTFAPNCWVFAKVDQDMVGRERASLGGDWIQYRLPPNFLDLPETRSRIKAQRDRFASFLRPLHPKFGPQLLDAWLWQFPDSDYQDSAIHLLEQIHFVEARQVIDEFREMLSGSEELSRATWLPLRPREGPGSSADALNVYLKDLERPVRNIGSITAREIESSQTVVLFDDSLNTGTQCGCLLSSWFGRDKDLCGHQSDADAQGALPEDVQEALRSVEIRFAYYSAHGAGEQKLRVICGELGLRLAGIHRVVDASSSDYTVEGIECSSEASKERFLGFLRKRGEALLEERVRADEAGWTAGRATEFALGYGGLNLRLVYQHSVSASTPPVLWMMSTDLLDPWIPLFPRRPEPLLALIGARSSGSTTKT